MTVPLVEQVLDVPYRSGLAEHLDERVAPAGALLRAHNVVMDHVGALRTRAGYGDLGLTCHDGGTLGTTQRHLIGHGAELLALGNHPTDGYPRLARWDESADKWTRIMGLPAATTEREYLIREASGASSAGIALAGGVLLAAWMEMSLGAETIRYTVWDEATRSVLVPPTTLATLSYRPIVFAMGTRIVVVYTDINVALYARVYDTTTRTWGAVQTLVAAAPLLTFHDAHPVDATYFVTVCNTNAAVEYKVHRWDVTNLGGGPTHTYTRATVALSNVSISAAGTNTVFVGHVENRNVYITGLTPSALGVTFGPTLVSSPAGDIYTTVGNHGTSGTLLIFGEITAGQTAMERRVYTGAGAAVGVASTTQRAWPTSKPFAHGGRSWVVGITANNIAATTALLYCCDVDTSDAGPLPFVAHALPFEAAGNTSFVLYQVTPIVQSLGDGRFLAAHQIDVGVPASGLSGNAADVIAIDFSQDRTNGLWQYATMSDALLLAGGYVGHYDGPACTELGFLAAPEVILTQANDAGGDLVPTKTYAYQAHYEWVDNDGLIHRGPLSGPKSITITAGNNCVDVKLSYLAATLKGKALGQARPATIVVHRTLGDAGVNGPFYRMNPVASTNAGFGGVIVNDRVAWSTTVRDLTSDVDVLGYGFGFLYTQGGELENFPPPPARCIATHKGRTWVVSSNAPREIWPSKLAAPGVVQGWDPALVVRIDDSPDGAVALAALDEELLVFTPTRIYGINGEGYNNAGGDAPWLVRLVSTDTGCLDPKSIATVPDGVLFRGRYGIMKIDRARVVSFVGAPVRDTTDAWPERTIAAHDREQQRVEFMLSAGGVERTVTYDYRHDVWTTSSFALGARLGHCMWGDAHVWSYSASGGGVAKRGHGTEPGFDPQQTYIPIDVWTPWLTPAGIAGCERVWRVVHIGTKLGPCALTVRLCTNLALDADTQSDTVDLSAASTVAGLPTWRGVTKVIPQRASALSIRYTTVLGQTFASLDGDEKALARQGIELVQTRLVLGVSRSRPQVPLANVTTNATYTRSN